MRDQEEERKPTQEEMLDELPELIGEKRAEEVRGLIIQNEEVVNNLHNEEMYKVIAEDIKEAIKSALGEINKNVIESIWSTGKLNKVRTPIREYLIDPFMSEINSFRSREKWIGRISLSSTIILGIVAILLTLWSMSDKFSPQKTSINETISRVEEKKSLENLSNLAIGFSDSLKEIESQTQIATSLNYLSELTGELYNLLSESQSRDGEIKANKMRDSFIEFLDNHSSSIDISKNLQSNYVLNLILVYLYLGEWQKASTYQSKAIDANLEKSRYGLSIWMTIAELLYAQGDEKGGDIKYKYIFKNQEKFVMTNTVVTLPKFLSGKLNYFNQGQVSFLYQKINEIEAKEKSNNRKAELERKKLKALELVERMKSEIKIGIYDSTGVEQDRTNEMISLLQPYALKIEIIPHSPSPRIDALIKSHLYRLRKSDFSTNAFEKFKAIIVDKKLNINAHRTPEGKNKDIMPILEKYKKKYDFIFVLT